ncbi:Acetyl-CoA acetyltransferase [Rosistilla ulvae]|uniref:Acetyl-CoA acetyltransferase n=1 Tax=Rosistilla ulvae TaxID=1930277 RepID=A0A517M459_9BACT|nr:thiolase family protein [Rosistilla ulvae]QDS89648.1 Acetyl-CoA acetyltransferase [Rosistilla ulvae]
MIEPLKPIAILAGQRTPFAKAYGAMNDVSAAELGRAAVAAALSQAQLKPDQVEELVFGNVSGPADSANIARVVALQAGIPHDRIAHTVNRNCGSGMESILSGWQIIRESRARVVVAGGTESMSGIPLLVRPSAAKLLMQLSRSKRIGSKLAILAKLRPRHFKPVAGVMLGLTDPVSGLNMGETAEVLAKEFAISRDDQDAFALQSHQKAVSAREQCFLSGEITPIEFAGRTIDKDDGPRANQSIGQLRKLKPIFDPHGTVTAGNSCPLTDGAAAVLLVDADDDLAKTHPPLGRITAYAIAGCDPRRMGLGPVYATAKLLKQTGLTLSDFDLFEINEAFAAQVLACLAAMQSTAFARQELDLSSPMGELPVDRLNVHGGAIALGHPVGTTGTRMVITLLRALRERGMQRGLATLCIGGGQGFAMVVET